MTTTYFVTYIIKTKNGRRHLIETPQYETEAEARAHYEYKTTKDNVVEARLCQRDHYDQEELTPRAAAAYPYGKDYARIINTFTRI